VSATLRLKVSAVSGSSWNMNVYAEASDDCATFSSASRPSARPRTGAFTNWQPASSVGWKDVSVTSVVQEVVNRAGWAANNDLCIIVRDNNGVTGNQFQYVVSYDGAPTGSAILLVEWAQ
jgi:hypothetical protein